MSKEFPPTPPTQWALDTIPLVDTVVFDVDSTILNLEVLDELALFCNTDVSSITNRAMNGEISFAQALVDRIEVIGLCNERFHTVSDEFISHLISRTKLTVSIIPLLTHLYENGYNVYYVSGGFKMFIQAVFRQLFPDSVQNFINFERDIYANEFILPGYNITTSSSSVSISSDTGGSHIKVEQTCTKKSVVTVDTSLYTAQTYGKARVLETLLRENSNESRGDNDVGSVKDGKKPLKNIIMVGDGVTDLQTKPPALGVVGYGGICERDIVKKKSDWFIYDYMELLNLFKQK
jgi:phosphoserine phosphatase